MPDDKFLPPQRNDLLTRLLQSISYLVLYFVYRIKVVVDDRDIALLREIEDRRVVYLPNHSNLDDGLVMFLFSARLGQLFHYVVAYEAFRGIIGRLLQKVGAYSIRRGMGDRSSIVQTLHILQQPKAKLVIFPEGGCSYQNDTVMPFRTGGIELALKTVTKLAKHDPVPDLYLVPVSIKYFYLGDTDRQIAKSLSDLETALSIQPTSSDFYLRLREIGSKVIDNLETEYQLTPNLEPDWNQRIIALKEHLLNYCERKLDISPATQLPNRERIYKIQSMLAELEKSNGETGQKTIDYQHLKLTTVRLLNFDAIYDGYVADEPTPERFFATLDRLEREVFQIDRPKPKGLRQVKIKIDTPINLGEYLPVSKCDRQELIQNLTQTVRQKVQVNLNSSY